MRFGIHNNTDLPQRVAQKRSAVQGRSTRDVNNRRNVRILANGARLIRLVLSTTTLRQLRSSNHTNPLQIRHHPRPTKTKQVRHAVSFSDL
jgi:hypothetical protein